MFLILPALRKLRANLAEPFISTEANKENKDLEMDSNTIR